MKIKTLLLGSAAVLGVVGAAGTALAADAKPAKPVAKPAPVVQYVQVCDLYGTGFFLVPGQKDTCMRIQGSLEMTLNFHSLSNVYVSSTSANHSSNWNFTAQGQVTITGRRSTDHGDLQGVIRFTGVRDNAANVTDSAGNRWGNTGFQQVDRAWIQLGNKFAVKVGYDNSVYQMNGISITQALNNTVVKQIALNWDLGGGLLFSLGVDDPRDRSGSRLPAIYNMPDVTGAIQGRYALGAWGISAGVQKTGVGTVWGVNGKLTVNVNKTNQLQFQLAGGTSCALVVNNCGQGLTNNTQFKWGAVAGLQSQLTPRVREQISVAYVHDFDNTTSTTVRSDTRWQFTSASNLYTTTRVQVQWNNNASHVWTGYQNLVWDF